MKLGRAIATVAVAVALTALPMASAQATPYKAPPRTFVPHYTYPVHHYAPKPIHVVKPKPFTPIPHVPFFYKPVVPFFYAPAIPFYGFHF